MPHPNIEIRPFESSDSLVELTDLLHRAYARLGSMGLNYTAVDQTVETTERYMREGNCFVAVMGKELVGTILPRPPQPDSECFRYTQPHVASAHKFAVAPEFQGRGLGSALLARAEQWARENHFTELALDTAQQAIHLVAYYNQRGYRRVDTIQWPGKTYESVVLSKSIEETGNDKFA